MQFTLHALFRAKRHVVTQVVEAVFVVGTVGDIRVIGFTFGGCRQTGHVDANGHAQEFEQGTVVFGITLCQIVVDGNDVNAFTGQCVQVGRQRCGQGFTFTGTHFRDAALVKHHTTQQLNVEVTHAKHTFTGLTHNGEGFRDQAFQRFAFFKTRAEFYGFRFQLVIRELLHRRLHAIDDGNSFAHTAQGTIVTTTKNFC